MALGYRNTLRFELKRAHTVDEAVENTQTRLPWITTPDLLTVWAVAFGLKDEIDDLIRETFETARADGIRRLGARLVLRQRRHRLGREHGVRRSARSARAPRRRRAPATAVVGVAAAAAPAAASSRARLIRTDRARRGLRPSLTHLGVRSLGCSPRSLRSAQLSLAEGSMPSQAPRGRRPRVGRRAWSRSGHRGGRPRRPSRRTGRRSSGR